MEVGQKRALWLKIFLLLTKWIWQKLCKRHHIEFKQKAGQGMHFSRTGWQQLVPAWQGSEHEHLLALSLTCTESTSAPAPRAKPTSFRPIRTQYCTKKRTKVSSHTCLNVFYNKATLLNGQGLKDKQQDLNRATQSEVWFFSSQKSSWASLRHLLVCMAQ